MINNFSEDDLIPMSALSHVSYCPRRYALIHLEQIWEENRFTAEGDVLHERVHNEHSQSRKTFREEYSMGVRSLEYGLTGKCDLVELWFDANNKTENNAKNEVKNSAKDAKNNTENKAEDDTKNKTENRNPIKVNPVEFKRGRTKENDADRVQLCAQAICLEEMFHIPIDQAQLYYLQERRRKDIAIDENLRKTTIELTQKIREIRSSNQTPIAVYEKRKCTNCSLVDICMPEWTQKSVSRYIKRQISLIEQEHEEHEQKREQKCENY
ncbi:CRISPR-associated protein Cas4 [Campylobacterota bacterium]|nr:CRISPR-associated protein Cas4 [Campylobacterota bacterium]